MYTRAFILAATIIILCSCREPERPQTIQSFELSYDNDTINVIDHHGRKQGIWIKPGSTDTVVYLNDTAYSPQGMTVRELIRSLNEKRK